MKKKRIMASFPIRILAVSIPGLLAGLFLNATRTMGLTSGALNLVVTARYVLSQIITFLPHQSPRQLSGSLIFPCLEPQLSHPFLDI